MKKKYAIPLAIVISLMVTFSFVRLIFAGYKVELNENSIFVILLISLFFFLPLYVISYKLLLKRKRSNKEIELK